jgi:hypothetical protein
MTTAELREATKEFDREFSMDSFRPLTPAQRALWEKKRPLRGRPRVGQGAAVVSVSIEKGLLSKTDRLAKKMKTSRAKLVAEGLQVVLSRYEAKPAKRSPRKAA